MISDKVGYWLQVIANLGLLIGLIMVGLQIYQSNVIALSQVYQHRADLRSEGHRSVAESSDLAVLIAEMQADHFDDLTDAEKIQLRNYVSIGMLLIDNNLFQREIGLLQGTWSDDAVLRLYGQWETAGVRITQRLRDWHSGLLKEGEE